MSDPVQYRALVTCRSGLHISYAERRCQVFVTHSLLERDSDEVAYRLTADGRYYLSRTASEHDSSP